MKLMNLSSNATPHEILRVEPDASEEEIHQSLEKLHEEYSPQNATSEYSNALDLINKAAAELLMGDWSIDDIPADELGNTDLNKSSK